jgi:tetratricopeptide (TPR) repeat protein
MADVKDLRSEELVNRGRGALRAGRFRLAYEMLNEYCDRQIAEEQPIRSPVLADYAVSMAHVGDIKEAAEVCFRALSVDRRNADAYAALARIYVLAGSRRKAIEAMERGFAVSPRHPALRSVQDEIGVRRNPVIPFLSRDSRVNMILGKIFDKFRQKRRVA